MILHKAVQDNRPKQVRLLLKAGVGVDCVDNNGVTALMSVSTLNNSTARRILVRILLSYQANCNRKDKQGQTAVAWACKLGRDDVIHQILKSQKGADLDFSIADNEGRSYLFLATSSGNCKAVRQILQSMKKSFGFMKLHCPDNRGVSPLVEAFRQGHYECVKILVEEGKASVSSFIKYLESQEDARVREKLIQDIARSKRTNRRNSASKTKLRNNSTRSNGEENLQECDVEQFLLSRGDDSVETEGKLPPIGKSQLVSKNLKRRRRKAKPNPLFLNCESKTWTVKLFSLYAEQCSKSFVKESFPLIRHVPATQFIQTANTQEPCSSHLGASRKGSQGSSIIRQASLIPPLIEVDESKQAEIKRKKSVRAMVRKASTQQSIKIIPSIPKRKRSSTVK